MAEIVGRYITDCGRAMIVKGQTGTATHFTRFGVCAGDYAGVNPRTLKALLSERKEFSINHNEIINKTTILLRGLLTNENVEEGFFVNAIGLFAEDPDEGEVLHTITLFDKSDYLPARSGAHLSTIGYSLYADISDSENVTIDILPGAYADALTLVNHIADYQAFLMTLKSGNGKDKYLVSVDQETELPENPAPTETGNIIKNGTIKTIAGWFANMIRSITGKKHWWEKPKGSIEDIYTHLDQIAARYSTCSTASATVAKTVALSGFTLNTGAKITVKFTNANTATAPTLNVNSTGAKSIFYKGTAVPTGLLVANSFYDFLYDGTYWQLTGVELGTAIYSATAKTSLADADTLPLTDSASSNVLKKITFANLKAELLKLTGYAKATTASAIAATDSVSTALGKLEKKLDDNDTLKNAAEKTTPVDADAMPFIDSADNNAMKKVTWANIKNAVKSFIYGLYHGYVTCSTAAGTTAKTVTLSGFTLEVGTSVKIKFTNVNTAANSTLNVNSTGAKPIYYKGIAIPPDILSANVVYEFVYNGTQYDLIGVPDVYTKAEIDTQLNNKENSIKDAAAKTTPVDADALPLIDSSASNVTKKVTFANLKSTLLKLTGYAKATTAAAVAATDSVSTAIGKLEKKVDDHTTDLNNKVSINFIHNWYFLNPINQRAVSGTITTLGYFIDRWKLISGSVTLTNKGLTLNGTIVQILETAVGTNVIASVKMYSGTANASYDNGTKTFTVTSSGGTINSVKLEIGEVSTLAYDPPMDFGKELAVCQRYYETSWSADLPLKKDYHGFTLLYGRQLQTYLEANFPFKTPKRVTPVMSIFSYNMTPNTVSRDDSSRSDAASPNAVAAYGTTGFVHLIFSVGAITDGERYGCKWIADADL